MKTLVISSLSVLVGWMFLPAAQGAGLNNQKIDGYRGIWFGLNQFSEYGDKYSGGLGTYTAKHRPVAVYAEAVDKTFFVYGGTTAADERHLLCMIGSYDHATDRVSRPTVVFDKQGVDDPHDNPSLIIDDQGYLWVFVSGRSTLRSGFKLRSEKPYDIDSFRIMSEEEMTYPQPWILSNNRMLHLFTKYTGVRELYFESSADGSVWTEDRKLAGIRIRGQNRAGHYQMSARSGDNVGTFFNRHPNGDVDRRTDLYFMQTSDGGETWTTVGGRILDTPLTEVAGPARVIDYSSWRRNVYLKDMDFDEHGHPVGLYLTSLGHEPGPLNSPREFKVTAWDGEVWHTHTVCETDHNYDMGSLYLEGDRWRAIVPSQDGPQHYGTGGEVAIWESTDRGKRWVLVRQLTANSVRNHAYMRRPEFARDPFYCFWADGDAEAMSISKLYFSDSSGRIRELPYTMSGDFEQPFFRSGGVDPHGSDPGHKP